jgi:hypothetical protein
MPTRIALLVAFIPVLASAQSKDWATGIADDGEYHYAATANDSGHLLGQFCYPELGNCIYLVATSTACKENDEYGILANSDAGAQQLNVICRGTFGSGSSKKYRYVFSDFEAVDKLVKQANRVGFAMPLKDGHFNVVRFTLSSSNVEIERMRAAASSKNQGRTKPTTSTRDIKM